MRHECAKRRLWQLWVPGLTASPRAERYASVDIGSNTLKALIVRRESDGSLSVLEELGWATRLGEGIHAGRLREAAIRRTLAGLQEVADLCAKHHVQVTACVGTSALRDASNQGEFIDRAAELGLTVEAITGEEEARLSFLAVRLDPLWRSAGPIAVMDIGGGSTELIVGTPDGRINARQSLKLGAVRLTEACLRGDPPTASELHAATDGASTVLRGFPMPGGVRLIAVGGTITNMGAVHAMAAGGALASLHGLRLTGSDVESQIRLYAGRTLEQRRSIAGLDPARADVILGGAIIVSQVMALAGAECVEVSCRGLRWGLLYERFGP